MQTANISPTRILPPPDAVSSISQDSNSIVETVKDEPISVVPESERCVDTSLENLQDNSNLSASTYNESPWSLRKPYSGYSPGTSTDIHVDEHIKTTRNRVPKKFKTNAGSLAQTSEIFDDEINENSQLLDSAGTGRIFPQETVPILEFNHNPELRSSMCSSSSQKRFLPQSRSSTESTIANKNNNTNKKNYSRTTHITQV